MNDAQDPKALPNVVYNAIRFPVARDEPIKRHAILPNAVNLP